MKLPQRPESHCLERDSNMYFQQCLPRGWETTKPESDYGIDLIVSIYDEGFASGREILVQLKASGTSTKNADETCEKVRLNLSTYNLLINKLQVVMIVKYIADENCAYWQLLSQVDEPNQENETMTVHIPRTNKLSEINWPHIRSYIEYIQQKKLGTREKITLADFV